MKTLLRLILILGTLSSFAQTSGVVIIGDSLVIRDLNIATNPFNFGNDPLTFLTTKFKPDSKKIELFNNRHADNDIDTAYSFSFGPDKFEIYQWDMYDNAILYADLLTNNFPTKHGIVVGMKKSEVIKLLHKYDLTSLPKYLVLENTEIIVSMRLEFSGDLLIRIRYQGYMD